MAANPSAQAAARAEVDAVLDGRLPTAADLPALDYLGRTLQETLRLYPAAPILITRRSVRPLTLGGWQLPARTMFGIPLNRMRSAPSVSRPARRRSRAAPSCRSGRARACAWASISRWRR